VSLYRAEEEDAEEEEAWMPRAGVSDAGQRGCLRLRFLFHSSFLCLFFCVFFSAAKPRANSVFIDYLGLV